MRLSRWCFQDNGRPLFRVVSFFLLTGDRVRGVSPAAFRSRPKQSGRFCFHGGYDSRDGPMNLLVHVDDAYQAILGAKYKPSPHSLEVPPIGRLD